METVSKTRWKRRKKHSNPTSYDNQIDPPYFQIDPQVLANKQTNKYNFVF